MRLRSLRIGSAGRDFEGGHSTDIARLLQRSAVLAIEDEDKTSLGGILADPDLMAHAYCVPGLRSRHHVRDRAGG